MYSIPFTKPIHCAQTKVRGVPFMADSRLSISGPRVMEALIIALVTSFIGYIMTVPKIEARLDSIEEVVKDHKVNMTYELRGIKSEMGDLRKDLYAPVGGRYVPAPDSSKNTDGTR